LTLAGTTFVWSKVSLKPMGNDVDTTTSDDAGWEDVASYVRRIEADVEFFHTEALDAAIFTDNVVTFSIKPTTSGLTYSGTCKLGDVNLDMSVKDAVKGKLTLKSKGAVSGYPTPP
jgi:hypothetical protein